MHAEDGGARRGVADGHSTESMEGGFLLDGRRVAVAVGACRRGGHSTFTTLFRSVIIIIFFRS